MTQGMLHGGHGRDRRKRICFLRQCVLPHIPMSSISPTRNWRLACGRLLREACVLRPRGWRGMAGCGRILIILGYRNTEFGRSPDIPDYSYRNSVGKYWDRIPTEFGRNSAGIQFYRTALLILIIINLRSTGTRYRYRSTGRAVRL